MTVVANPPRVWVLLGKGAGGNAQMLTLARALGWPYEAKQLHYNALNILPNILLGANAISLDRQRSASLAPPWPDLVIAASRRSAPVARWIKRQAKGRTRLVHLLHAQAPLHHFDLIVTLPQFRLPQLPNLLHNTLPLNIPDAAVLARAGQRWQPEFAPLPRPWIAVLVGGNSSAYRLDAATATQLGLQASTAAREAGGSLLVTTSPRTPQDAAVALLGAINAPAFCYRWKSGDTKTNPYPGILALADRFIVTADSASLPAEACATGKPVQLFKWPARKRYLRSMLLRLPLAPRLYAALIYSGWIKPRRDFTAFHHVLEAQGLVGPNPQGHRPVVELERTVQRIRTLMSMNRPL